MVEPCGQVRFEDITDDLREPRLANDRDVSSNATPSNLPELVTFCSITGLHRSLSKSTWHKAGDSLSAVPI